MTPYTRTVSLIVLVLTLLCGGVYGANDGYGYVTSFTLNTSEALTNYQMDFTLSNATGLSTGGVLYTDGHTRADWADINFTDSTGNTPLSFWLREGTGTTTTQEVTVLVPSISDDNSTRIKLYYGDPEMSESLSNGTATFPFFEDFSSLDTATKWTAVGTPTVSGGILNLTSGGTEVSIINKNDVCDNPGETEYRAKSTHFGLTYKEGVYHRRVDASSLNSVMFSHSLAEYAMRYYITKNAIGETAPAVGWSAGTWGIVKSSSTGTTVVNTINGGNAFTHNASLYYAGSGKIWFIATTAAGAQLYADWVVTRAYASTPPTTSGYIKMSNTLPAGASYSFIHLSDIHLLTRTTPEMLNITMSAIETLKPQYNISAVFITGDIISEDEPDDEGQIQAYQRSLTLITVPVYEVAGNHDWGKSGHDSGLWDTYIPNGASKHDYGFNFNDFAVYGLAWNGASTDYYTTTINATAQTQMITYFNATRPKIPIILSHAYMFQNGTLLTPIGHQLLNNVTSDTIILSGHEYLANNPGRLNFTRSNGYNVVEDLINYQGYTPGTALGGRIYTFNPAAPTGNLRVGTVSFYPDLEVIDGIADYTLNTSPTTPGLGPTIFNWYCPAGQSCQTEITEDHAITFIPQPVYVNSTSNWSPTLLNWSWGDGHWTNGTGDIPSASHLYSALGTYNIFVIGSNASGSNQSASKSVDVILPYAITNLTNTTPTASAITWNWEWDAPIETVLMIFQNGTFWTNSSNTTTSRTWTGLPSGTNMTFSSLTCYDAGRECNTTWVNRTALTAGDGPDCIPYTTAATPRPTSPTSFSNTSLGEEGVNYATDIFSIIALFIVAGAVVMVIMLLKSLASGGTGGSAVATAIVALLVASVLLIMGYLIMGALGGVQV